MKVEAWQDEAGKLHATKSECDFANEKIKETTMKTNLRELFSQEQNPTRVANIIVENREAVLNIINA